MAGNKALSVLLSLTLFSVACLPEARLVEQLDDTLPSEGLHSLDIVVGAGDLWVDGVEGLEAVQVEVRIYTQNPDCDADAEVLDSMDYELYATTEGEARLWVDTDDDWGTYWADVTVLAPAHLALEIRDGTGDIDVRGFASLELDDENGDVTIEAIAGDVEIEDGTGDLRLMGVGGAVSIDDGNGDLDLIDIDGPLELFDGSGDAWIEGVRADVRIEDGNGDLDIRAIDGDVTIDDGSGDIDVRGVSGVVRIHDGNGDIHAEDVGDLEVIEDGSGDIDWD
jgi:hypothetical protein